MPRLIRRCVWSVALLLSCGSARAHGSIEGIGDFWNGMLHPVTALEQILAIATFGMLMGRDSDRLRSSQFTMLGALLAGAIVGHVWPSALTLVHLFNIGALIVLGALVAGAWRISTLATHVLAAFVGAVIGYVTGAEIVAPVKAHVFVPGALLASFVISAYGCMLVEFVLKQNRPWLVIASRVVGSWIAAIGMLVLAISLGRTGGV